MGANLGVEVGHIDQVDQFHFTIRTKGQAVAGFPPGTAGLTVAVDVPDAYRASTPDPQRHESSKHLTRRHYAAQPTFIYPPSLRPNFPVFHRRHVRGGVNQTILSRPVHE